MSETLAEQLEALAAKATPGLWLKQPNDEVDMFVPIIADNLGGLVGGAMLWPTEIENDDFTRAEANAALIVALRNNLPAIITALKEADHPSAEDYRNRAERAEQEATELRESDPWEQVGFWKEKAEQVERDLSDLKDKGLVIIREKTELRETVARQVRSAFMEGFTSAVACLPEGDGDCLTEDVEADMWADSNARTALENPDG